MRFLIQRVSRARVLSKGETLGSIDKGLLVFAAFAKGDTEAKFEKAVNKVLGLRVFEDESGKMNKSILEEGGGVLLVSQFTLYGDLRKGRRPSYDAAMPVEEARDFYEAFAKYFRSRFPELQEGEFQAHMDVELINDGPLTFSYEL